jgi:hypothetical protein
MRVNSDLQNKKNFYEDWVLAPLIQSIVSLLWFFSL